MHSDNDADPVSFVITCISLGLALQLEFRTLIQKIVSLKWLFLLLFPRLWKKLTTAKFRQRFQKRGTAMDTAEESVELEQVTSEVLSKV